MSAFLLCTTVVYAQSKSGFAIVEQKDKRQVDILYNNKLLTAYCYYDSSRKPILFPVNTVDGITVTRSYPFIMVPGERTDHPHHTGIWFNYESVNGLDFWNNSTAIAPGKRDHYGTIFHKQVVDKQTGKSRASLTTIANWVTPANKILLEEKSVFHFRVTGNDFIIDRITTLTAMDSMVVFKDVKDGMFAIRVARELEMPSRETSSFVDSRGNITTVKHTGGNNVSGMYYSSEGKEGDSVWSSKGRWAVLNGKKEDKEISIGIFDHPSNIGYPAYWHARGYGLFAINPLGRKIFSRGAEELNFSLSPHQSATFRYRIVIHSGSHLSNEKMNELSSEFAKIN